MRRVAPRLGPFELLAPIGRGAGGEVWRAWHRGSRVALAVKLLHATRDDDDLRAMGRELRAVARMDHPGIVRVHDHGQLDRSTAEALGMSAGTPYIVMDFAGPKTMRSHLGERPWPALRADLLALLDALGHAHARGVIHRDLKPDNVLMGPQGPVLTDFGVALATEQVDNDDGSTGTPNYMAPEQVRGEQWAIAPATDLYAVGCLAYALATGRPPFAGRGSIGAMQGHLRETPVGLGAPWPPAFDAWVARLLAKAPEDRFAFAAEAAFALAAIPDDRDAADRAPATLQARPLTPLPDWRRPEPPRPLRLAGVHRSLADLRQIDPVGREPLQSTLWSILARVVRRRRPEVVVLDGATGRGTGHLARWLARRAHELGIAEGLLARPDPDETDAALPDMLARALRLSGLSGPTAVEQAARALALPSHDRAALIAAAAANPDWRVDGHDTVLMLDSAAEFRVALALAIDRLAAIRPRILVVDDAQWSPACIAFAEHLAAREREMPLLVVLTVLRDQRTPAVAEQLDELAGRRPVTRLTLDPLPPSAVGEMVRRVAPAGNALVDALVERARGDGSRALALLRLWDARGALVQDEDGLRLARREPPMPAADPELWLERVECTLSAVSDAQWMALELAATFGALIGPALWPRLVDAAGLPDEDAHWTLLAPLGDAGLLADENAGWGIAHTPLRDALLARAQRADRARRWHRACAAALAERGEEAAERLARHRLAAGDPEGAIDPFIVAAARARRRTEGDRVRRNLLDAARALRATGRGVGDPRWAELHARWALVDISSGRLGRARRRARRADRRARTEGHRALSAYVLGEALLGAEPQTAELHLRRAEKHARLARDLRLLLRCAEARGWSLYHRGRYAKVESLTAALLGELAQSTLILPLANLHFLRAVAGRARGDSMAHGHLARAAALYRRAGGRHGQASVRNEMGETALAAGDHETALVYYRAARRIFDELASRSVIVADLNLGRVHDAMGQHREGEAHRREALRVAESRGDPVMQAFAAVCLLVDAARLRRFDLWPTRFAHFGPLLDGSLVAPEAAEAARRAGELALAADAHDEARRAFDLAAIQFTGIGREAEAQAMRAAAADAGLRAATRTTSS